MKTRNHLKILIPSLLLLAGCSGVMSSAQPAKQYYMLMPLSGSAVDSTGEPLHGLVMTVTAVPGLDTDRIQALGSEAQLVRYANARWPDHLPEVLTSVMQRSMQSAGRFSEVKVASRPGPEDWFLQLELQKFYGLRSVGENTTQVIVQIAGIIECSDRRTTFTVEDSVPVSSERLSAVVSAHQQGLDGATRKILDQIGENC
jgi:ABC-type uncharacterized transport system auxiliary subunit